jgi:drug/metabolite transporter (DMT)-like permease
VTPILLAAASALVWGAADYAGGRATRGIDALWVTVGSKLVSIPVLVLYLAVLPAPLPEASLAWGTAAGIVGFGGLIVFYRALSAGAMAVVAPVSALTTALLPFGFGLITGDRPDASALVGVVCAIAAIGLVSVVPGDGSSPVTAKLIGMALAAGSGFGLFFILLAQANRVADGDAGLWPIAAAQVGALLVGLAMLAVRRSGPASGGRRLHGWIAVAGVFDMTANALYLVAVRDGLLAIVAPIAALYPVSTVVLALVVDRERVRPLQVAGLGLAVAALVLVTA